MQSVELAVEFASDLPPLPTLRLYIIYILKSPCLYLAGALYAADAADAADAAVRSPGR